MSLDMKGVKRYCKVWCLRFEGASAESSKMLRIPNYLTPYKVLRICFNSSVTVLPFFFSFTSLHPFILEQSPVLILIHLMLICASTMARLESFIEKIGCTLRMCNIS